VGGGGAMLLTFSNISNCYRHAADARHCAKQACDPAFKEAFLEVERCWLNLARSYAVSEHLSALADCMTRRNR
jgi:hypothetical protein